MIQLHDKQFVPFISAKEIEFAITKMVQQVEDDFIDETPVFIGVLNGSFMVVSDFMKQYTKPCEVSFIKMAFEGTSSTNEVKQLIA
jgi:hypoxanthine phosphoribosyltransferase